MPTHTIDFDVVGWTGPRESGSAEVAHYDFVHRLLRSLAAVGIVWLVALGILVVMPWSVIYVGPLALALSVFFFVVRIRAPEVATKCRGTCPDCGFAQKFDVPVKFELPVDTACANCHRQLTLEPHVEGT